MSTLPIVLLCTLLIFIPTEGTYLVTPVIPGGTDIEGLRYDSYNNKLYYSDVAKKTINRYDPETTYTQVLQLSQIPTLVIPVYEYAYTFLVALDRDIVVLNWDYDSEPDNELTNDYNLLTNTFYTYFTCLLTTVDCQCHGNRWNDGQVDAFGNLWAGTLTILDPPDCRDCPPSLYRLLTTRSGLQPVDVAVQNFYQNGIEFTVDYRVMYVIDYYNRQVYAFQFDLPRSIISCPQVIFRYDDYNLQGYPDGIVKDTDGNLWIGSFNGSQVIQINPYTGELLQTIDIPACEVTTLTFGGCDLDILYVGTKLNGDPVQALLDPLGGTVFEVEGLGVYGVPQEEAVVNTYCKPTYY